MIYYISNLKLLTGKRRDRQTIHNKWKEKWNKSYRGWICRWWWRTVHQKYIDPSSFFLAEPRATKRRKFDSPPEATSY